MKIAGSYTLHSLREQVWPLIQDPASLVRLIPGCEQLEQVSPAEYRGQMQIPVAAVAGTYSTYVRLLDNPEPYLTRFEGEMNGPAGAMRGQAWFRLAAGDDAATAVLTYEGQGIISGPLGRMDGRFTESVARSLLNQGLANLDRQLQEQALASSIGQPAPARDGQRSLTVWIRSVGRFLGLLARRLRAFLAGK